MVWLFADETEVWYWVGIDARGSRETDIEEVDVDEGMLRGGEGGGDC